ncbi:hypothetical protein [Nocardioides mesophilus]|uniref:Uncharacterized protein n=1 Tax=Nocardioides mesophilus TaxID=433659 RepID=A0A7G9R7Y1_9ACTN|nr:hypothetical protein [Nocardioides mesophilus]QNN51706.1 hypothetical protein H9L09_14200 [Nocardioides mesophilus]
MTSPSKSAPAGTRAPRSPLASWVWPPLLAVALLIGYRAVREGGFSLDPELIVSIVVFLVVAVAVGVFGRRYEAGRTGGGSRTRNGGSNS